MSTLVGLGGLCVNCVPNGKSPPAGLQVGGRWHIMSSGWSVDFGGIYFGGVGGNSPAAAILIIYPFLSQLCTSKRRTLNFRG